MEFSEFIKKDKQSAPNGVDLLGDVVMKLLDRRYVRCTSAELLRTSMSEYVYSLQDDDFVQQLAAFATSASDKPPSVEQAHEEQVSAVEELSTYLESDNPCHELAAVLASRASLLNAYVMLSSLAARPDDLKRMKSSGLFPSVLTYLHDVHDLQSVLGRTEKAQDSSEIIRNDASVSNSISLPSAVWSECGQGDANISVDINFEPGIYRFNLDRPSGGGDWGSVSLEHIISVPANAFEEYVYFPTQMRVEDGCRIYATLEVSIYNDRQRWEVSITRLG